MGVEGLTDEPGESEEVVPQPPTHGGSGPDDKAAQDSPPVESSQPGERPTDQEREDQRQSELQAERDEHNRRTGHGPVESD